MMIFRYKFVDNIPERLDPETIYISIEYCTAAHKCICGCGNEVVTPLSPTDWRLTFDGRSISLYPSIGNWNFDCKSHYWIIKNEIKNAEKWSDYEIERGRKFDNSAKVKYYNRKKKKGNRLLNRVQRVSLYFRNQF